MANSCDSIWEGDRIEQSTVLEGIVANGGDPIREVDRSERRSFKDLVPERGQAAGEGNGRELRAGGEGTVAEGRDTLRHGDKCNVKLFRS